MYATCIFCHAALGTNESIEHFPVGKRLAYDAAKGRLWAVCPKCERWNLTPLEERWEAIDEAERHFRKARKRISTENIGLARLPDGTDLVRIGAPLRPEFAAWRYGDKFGRRFRRKLVLGTGAVIAGTAAIVAGPMVGLGVFTSVTGSITLGAIGYRRLVPRAIVGDENNTPLALTGANLADVRFSLAYRNNAICVEFPFTEWTSTGWALRKLGIRRALEARSSETASLEGPAAERAMSKLLPGINGSGGAIGASRLVQRAVHALEENSGSLNVLLHQALNAQEGGFDPRDENAGVVQRIPTPFRLALEMSVHEADERRALEGELKALEQRWKDAEEIAAIADGLVPVPGVDSDIGRLRDRREE